MRRGRLGPARSRGVSNSSRGPRRIRHTLGARCGGSWHVLARTCCNHVWFRHAPGGGRLPPWASGEQRGRCVEQIALPRAKLFDTLPDVRAARWAAALSTARSAFDQLAQCGLDKDAGARRVRKGWLHRVHRRRLRRRLPPRTRSTRTSWPRFSPAATRLPSAIGRRARWPGSCAGTGGRSTHGPGSAERCRPGIRFHRVRSLTPSDAHAPPRHPLHHACPGDPRDRAPAVRPAPEAPRPSGPGRDASASVRQFDDMLRRANGHRGSGADRRDHRHRPGADL